MQFYAELDDHILKILNKWQEEKPGAYEMPFKNFYDELSKLPGVISRELLERKAHLSIKELEEKGFIAVTQTKSAKNGLLKLTTKGRIACKGLNLGSVNDDNENSLQIPMADQSPDSSNLSLQQLASKNEEFSLQLNRLDEVYRLKTVFYDNLSHNHIAIYFGLPSLGKTTIVRKFQSVAKDSFVPIMIDLKSCGRKNLDEFFLFFQDHISNELSDLYGDLIQFPAPISSQYRGGEGKELFLKFWSSVSRKIPNWKPILIIDEIGILSEDTPINDDVLKFMIEFMSNPKNGYFLLVGREKITRSRIDRFSELIGIGTLLEVKSFPFVINQIILDLIKKQSVIIEADLDKQIQFLCDGHPFIIRRFFETLFNKVSKTRPLEIRLEDFDMAINSTIDECDPAFFALFQDLSEEEQKVIKEWGSVYKNGETIFELKGINYNTNIALEKQFQRGITKLKNRGWVEETGENKFLFKFTFLLVWFRKQYYMRQSNEN